MDKMEDDKSWEEPLKTTWAAQASLKSSIFGVATLMPVMGRDIAAINFKILKELTMAINELKLRQAKLLKSGYP